MTTEDMTPKEDYGLLIDGHTRRSFLGLGVAGMAAAGLPQILRAKEQSATLGHARADKRYDRPSGAWRERSTKSHSSSSLHGLSKQASSALGPLVERRSRLVSMALMRSRTKALAKCSWATVVSPVPKSAMTRARNRLRKAGR